MGLEIMICTPAIRALIRDDKVHQIYSMIQSGQKYGMKTMNQSLADLYNSGKISLSDGMSFSANIQELNEILTRGKTPVMA